MDNVAIGDLVMAPGTLCGTAIVKGLHDGVAWLATDTRTLEVPVADVKVIKKAAKA